MAEAKPVIRRAHGEDVPAILELIKELAVYEKLSDEVVADEATLRRTLFGIHDYARALIAEQGGKPVGFAVFFFTYSTFKAQPGLFIEDLYVRQAERGAGIGMALFREIAGFAKERSCQRIEWNVLKWNKPAIAFYKKLGAEPLDEWVMQRLNRPAIEQLANNKKPILG